MNFLELQPLTLEQIPAAVALDQIALGGLWTEDGYRREIESDVSDLFAMTCATQAKAPLLALGCVWSILEEGHITLLAVHPDYRKQGLGQAMLVALMGAARRRELEWVTLEVRKTNERAIVLYKKFAFAEVGIRKRYYTNPEEDALILWCKGLRQPEFNQTLNQWAQQVSDRLYHFDWQFTPSSISNFYAFDQVKPGNNP